MVTRRCRPGGAQGGLVHQVGEIGAGETGVPRAKTRGSTSAPACTFADMLSGSSRGADIGVGTMTWRSKRRA